MNSGVNLLEEIKKPYLKYTIIISVIIIIAMTLTQSYWTNVGIKSVYHEYKAEEVLPTNNIPDGIFILSGNYSYISYWINTTKLSCKEDSNVKLLVYSQKEFGNFKNVIVMNVIDGCN